MLDIYYGLTRALGVDIEPRFGRSARVISSTATLISVRQRALLGYNPDYSFEDGIKLAIDWYRDNL